MEDAVELLKGTTHGEDAIMYTTHCLLWAACRCPAGKMAEEAAREGGKSVGWEIVYKSDGGFDYGLHIHDVFVVPNVRSLLDVTSCGASTERRRDQLVSNTKVATKIKCRCLNGQAEG